MRRLLTVMVTTCLLVGLGSACTDDEPGEDDPTGAVTSPSDRSEPSQPSQTDPEPPTEPPTPDVAGTVATGLTSPWGLAFLPDGSALVSERDTALIKLVDADGVATVGEVPGVDVTSTSEGGLLGIAIDPDFPGQPYVYAYFTASDDNRIVRMSYDGEGLGSPQVLIDGIPKATNHNGGRLGFGPDGMLYATTGDATEGSNAPDPESLGGKVLRITPTGDIPPDNPATGSPIYSSGHRNGQGIAWDDDGRLWQAEFGQDRWDELNLIDPGADYGWPECEGICDESGVVDPKVQWHTDEASPSGIAYARGAVWMAALRGERLWRIEVSGGRVAGQPVAFFTGDYGRLRTVVVAPDNSLWLTTSNTDGRGLPAENDDRILRLTLD